MDGPKARFKHCMAALGSAVYMVGGLPSSEANGKPFNDMWRFDFENVQAQGSDLVGVVAEKLAVQLPFVATKLLSSNSHLLASSSDNQIWCFDMKSNWKKIDEITIPFDISVLFYQGAVCQLNNNGGSIALFDGKLQRTVQGNFFCS